MSQVDDAAYKFSMLYNGTISSRAFQVSERSDVEHAPHLQLMHSPPHNITQPGQGVPPY